MDDVFDLLKVALADRYTIERELGRGGMAVVYLAQDVKHHREVAVKVLRPELAATLGAERFLREIEIAANLTHPHILPLFDSGEAGGFLFYVMPYLDGESLRDRLIRERQLPIEDALTLTREMATALSYAHDQGIVHRDIKPENVMLSAGKAVLADFGIARAVSAAGGEKLTETGMAVGTPAYMSPEQATAEEVDGRSDIYSLGCVVYEMLGGDPPYTGSTPKAVLARKLTDPVPSLQALRRVVSGELESVVVKALEREPVDRYATATQFAEALTTPSQTPPANLAPTRSRRSAKVTAAAFAVFVVIAALAVHQYVSRFQDPGPPPPNRPHTVLAAMGGSADSATRDAVEHMLRTGLDMSHIIQTVPRSEVRYLLGRMERPESTVLDSEMASELALRGGVSTVVLPRLDRFGDSYALTVRVEDASSGELQADANQSAENDAAIVGTVDAVVRELRRGLGERREVLVRYEPLDKVLTPSFDAWKKYMEGRALFRGNRVEVLQAIVSFNEALAIDTAFVSALDALAAAYGNAGYQDSMLATQRRILRFPDRSRASGLRNTEASVLFLGDVTRWDEAFEIWEREALLRSSPNYAQYLSMLGHLDSAINIDKAGIPGWVRDLRRFDSTRAISTCIGNTTYWAASTGRLPELLLFFDSLQLELNTDCLEIIDVWSSAAEGDFNRADSLLVAGPPRNRLLWYRYVNAVRGRIEDSYRAFADSVVGGSARMAAERSAILLEVVYGALGPDSVPKLTSRDLDSVNRYITHGVRAAIVGDTSKAKRVLDRLQTMRDSASSETFERAFGAMFALMEAGPALRRGAAQEAVATLRPWAQLVQEPGYGYDGGDTFLTWWVLADAYEKTGQPDSAIAQLELIVGPPRHQLHNKELYALAYSPAQFKLGQLYSQVGDTAQAIQHYARFIALFTDPDPGYVWMVEEARTELERFGRGR